MARIVMKFGGTSVGSVERIRAVSDRIAASAAAGNQIIIVVSAMSGETNRLLDLAHQLSDHPSPRELDVILATGEQVSIALVSIALESRGLEARSFSGMQARISTDERHTKARIRAIDPEPLIRTVSDGCIAVVAGFQGMAGEHITTLGRGGSDLTAVAIAAAVEADACEIYTDVDGVYTADPNIVPGAKKLNRISYEEMLEMASLGAKVLQSRSVELAMKERVPLHVRSSFLDSEGTWVTEEVPEMEDILVSGITHTDKEAKLRLRQVPDSPGVAASVFAPLAAENINVDMIIQNLSKDGTTDLTFTVSQDDLETAKEILSARQDEIGFSELDAEASVAKVSVVGVGMRSHAGIAAKMFETLSDNGINIQMISTSEIKISVVIDQTQMAAAVRTLHSAFDLD